MCILVCGEIKGEFLAKLWIVSPDQELQVTEFQIVCSDQEKGRLFVCVVCFVSHVQISQIPALPLATLLIP
jgi:hypothetical protein